MCDCLSILECCVVFSGVKLSIRSCNLFIKCWEGRGLTIAGRIQTFKTLAISKTLYITTTKNSTDSISKSP